MYISLALCPMPNARQANITSSVRDAFIMAAGFVRMAQVLAAFFGPYLDAHNAYQTCDTEAPNGVLVGGVTPSMTIDQAFFPAERGCTCDILGGGMVSVHRGWVSTTRLARYRNLRVARQPSGQANLHLRVKSRGVESAGRSEALNSYFPFDDR
ncbi:hypothetical protein ACTJKH_12080 [Microbacterium sp. 22215]|uniref:hypothetical protein n=1 Tax=Microbacterium sp. 22215 TaxID=3453893 RepID=UPI003F82EF3B